MYVMYIIRIDKIKDFTYTVLSGNKNCMGVRFPNVSTGL